MALVCLCHGVNERRIVREIERGACSISEISEACGAGGCCMSCHPTIDDLLAASVTPVTEPRFGRRRWAV